MSIKLDPVVEANRALLHERSQVGIKKYGTTLSEANLTNREILRHALEETLDLANYLQTELLRPEFDEAAAYRFWRECWLSDAPWFYQALSECMPKDYGTRTPTPTEFDTAFKTVMKWGQEQKNYAENQPK